MKNKQDIFFRLFLQKQLALVIVTLCLLHNNINAAEWKSITDSIITIDEVITKSLRYETYNISSPVYSFDSSLIKNAQATSLADLLLTNSSVSIHDKAGIATATMRGGNDKHTLLVWNGFGIRSATLGGLNFNTIPLNCINQISVQQGGSGTMYGSGAATGLIFISDGLQINNSGVSSDASIVLGSFHTHKEKLRFEINKKKSASSISVGYTYSLDDFTYGYPPRKNEHSAFNQLSLTQANVLKLYHNGKLETNFWYTQSKKLVPSLMSDTKPGTEEQTYHDIRGAINYGHYFSKGYIKTRIGVFSERNLYYDKDPGAVTGFGDNKAITLVEELEGKYNVSKNQILLGGINHTNEYGLSYAYDGQITRNRTSFFAAYHASLFWNYLNTTLEGRQELDDQREIPFIYSFGLNQKIWKGISFKGNFSKHYVLPTLNDLYWGEDAYAVGNPDLKPESGWNYEYGLKHIFFSEWFCTESEITFFNLNIDNWIVWEPDTLTKKYSPVNRDHVDSKGIEFINKSSIMYGKSKIAFITQYTYTNAVSYEYKEDTISFNRIYVPKHKLVFTLQYSRKQFYTQYNHYTVSKRYINGAGDYLKGYNTDNIKIAYKFGISKTKLTSSVSINNILNSSYQLSSGYPQPGRNFLLALNIHF